MDSPEMKQDWEKFLTTINGRYASEPQTPPAPPTPSAPPAPPVPPAAKPDGKPAEPPKEEKPRRIHWINLVIVGIVLLLLVGAGCYLLRDKTPADPYDGKIMDGIRAAGMDLGGMTPEEARTALATTLPLASGELMIYLPDGDLKLTPEETGLSLDLDGMIADAFAIGRTEEANPTELSIVDYLSMNEEAIRAALDALAEKLGESYSESSYSLEGEMPALDEEHFDRNAPLPGLVLTMGTPGITLDTEALWNRIADSVQQGITQISADDLLGQNLPEAPDIAAILAEFCVDPVDSHMDMDAHKAVPATYGIRCDAAALGKLVSAAAPGETIRAELEYVDPKAMGREIYFQDVLGFAQTPHSTSEKRTANLILACSVLNGIVLEPGVTFSYNATLGMRTTEKGYQSAPAYSGKELVDTVGGGICQVSSTLYLSSMFAELETVERVSHGYPSTYMAIGLDATVNWGAPDLKIRNNTDYPIKIIAEVADGFVRVWLMGTETRDYEVRIGFSSSVDGYARSYIYRYDRETGEQISKADGALSSYMDTTTSVVGELCQGDCYIYGNVRPQEPCSPTPEALEAALNYAEPNQYPDG